MNLLVLVALFCSEMSAVTREKELELEHAKQQYEAKLRRLQEELSSRAKRKDGQVLAQHGSAVSWCYNLKV